MVGLMRKARWDALASGACGADQESLFLEFISIWRGGTMVSTVNADIILNVLSGMFAFRDANTIDLIPRTILST